MWLVWGEGVVSVWIPEWIQMAFFVLYMELLLEILTREVNM